MCKGFSFMGFFVVNCATSSVLWFMPCFSFTKTQRWACIVSSHHSSNRTHTEHSFWFSDLELHIFLVHSMNGIRSLSRFRLFNFYDLWSLGVLWMFSLLKHIRAQRHGNSIIFQFLNKNRWMHFRESEKPGVNAVELNTTEAQWIARIKWERIMKNCDFLKRLTHEHTHTEKDKHMFG